MAWTYGYGVGYLELVKGGLATVLVVVCFASLSSRLQPSGIVSLVGRQQLRFAPLLPPNRTCVFVSS